MKKFEVIEDNSGGLIIVTFNQEGNVDYLHSGYEYVPGQLRQDLEALAAGADPVKDWDGNAEDPQGEYENIISYECGWEVVADNDSIYSDKMGLAACKEFGIIQE